MAKKGRRSSGKFRAVPFTIELALSTLANEIVIATNVFGSNSTRQSYIISVDAVYGMRGHTAAEGPIEVGYAHGDYSVTEIKEALEAGASFDPGNKVAQEQARRLVRSVGLFNGLATDENLQDGAKIRRTIKFAISQGFNLAFWAKNKNGAPLTTGSTIEVSGTAYMRQT